MGKNTDKNGKYLNKTEWIPIGKLTTDHIWNILLNVKNIDSLYKETMIEEIINREEELIKLWKLNWFRSICFWCVLCDISYQFWKEF